MAVKLIWRAAKVEKELNRYIEDRMRKIVLFLEAEAKKLVSRGNLTGTSPSRPGEPPKVRTGTLRANISFDVTRDQGEVVGILGVRKGLANSYAPILEDRLKLNRPYLRPTILQNRVKILKMLE